MAPGVAPEALERRTLLSAQFPGAVVGVTPGSTAAGLVNSPRLLVDDDGGAVMIRELSPIYPIGPAMGPQSARSAPAPAGGQGLDILLLKGPILSANAVASAAFDQAAEFVESLFHDPVTVVIDAEIAPLGGTTLGLANSIRMGDTFDTLRDLIVQDANPVSEAFVSQLPGEAGYFATLPDGSFSVSGASANRANLLALGVSADELNFGPSSEYDPSYKIDASITFSNQFPFDYDRSNGISFGLSDFTGVAIHEIVHALGFTSSVDEVDMLMNGGGREIAPTPLDLFRFEPGAGGADFGGGTRVLSPGSVVTNQVFYDGGVFDPTGLTGVGSLAAGDIPLSTGQFNGDAQQASHWKDDRFIGRSTPIGTMDPVSTAGRLAVWTDADTRAMDLIGWDAAAPAVPGSISGTVYQDDDSDGTRDAGEAGLPGRVVYQDMNDNAELDSSTHSAVNDSAVGIPDQDSVTSTIEVSGVAGAITDLDIRLTLSHSYIDDLIATVVSPSGTRVELFRNLHPRFNRSGGFEDTVFNDEAKTEIDNYDEAFPPYTFEGGYRAQNWLAGFDSEDPNGTWRLIVEDDAFDDEGTLHSWTVAFHYAEPSAETDGEGDYEFTDLAAGRYTLRQVPQDGFTQTEPTANNGAHVIDLAEGQQETGRNFGNSTGGPPPAQIMARRVFYNRSSFDGNSAAAGADDDGAIATDKSALLPNDGAGFANYTSYSRGINGIMLDVSNLPTDVTPGPDDFAFATGNDGNPFGWSPAPAPAQIAVRRGAGAGGSDRVTLTWGDDAVRNGWLQVTVLNTPRTGLRNPDVFYFGNLAGDTGNSDGEAVVSAGDVMAVRRTLAFRPQAGSVTSAFDFNRDGKVSALDLAIAKMNQAHDGLHLLAAPAAGTTAAAATAVPAPEATFSQAPVTSRATTLRLRTARLLDETPAPLLA